MEKDAVRNEPLGWLRKFFEPARPRQFLCTQCSEFIVFAAHELCGSCLEINSAFGLDGLVLRAEEKARC